MSYNILCVCWFHSHSCCLQFRSKVVPVCVRVNFSILRYFVTSSNFDIGLARWAHHEKTKEIVSRRWDGYKNGFWCKTVASLIILISVISVEEFSRTKHFQTFENVWFCQMLNSYRRKYIWGEICCWFGSSTVHICVFYLPLITLFLQLLAGATYVLSMLARDTSIICVTQSKNLLILWRCCRCLNISIDS